MAVEHVAGEGVGNNRRRLAGPHSYELILLEIGVDPKTMRRNDRQQVTAWGNISTNLRRAVADKSVNGLADFRIAEIEPRRLKIGARLLGGGCGLGNIRVQDTELLFCRGEGGLC